MAVMTDLSIAEGSNDDFCIRLIGTTGSPNMLASDLTVTFSITNDNAGIVAGYCASPSFLVYGLQVGITCSNSYCLCFNGDVMWICT